jgi:hypothetical protein
VNGEIKMKKRTRNNYKKMADPGQSISLEGRRIVKSAPLTGYPAIGKDEDPIHTFYDYVATVFDIPKEELDVSMIGLGRETTRKFNERLIGWMRRQKEIRLHRFEYEFGMVNLMYGPVFIEELEEDKVHLLERIEDNND